MIFRRSIKYKLLPAVALFLCACGDNSVWINALHTIILPIAAEKPPKESLQCKKGEEYSVKVVGIADGDTFTGLTADSQQVKCRIYGIDAPEKTQAFSNRSKQTLSGLIFGQQVQIKIQSKDRWQRAVVRVYASDNRDVAAEMIRAGMAWHFKLYSKDKKYADLENVARQQKIGLWADENPVAPWEVRKNERQK